MADSGNAYGIHDQSSISLNCLWKNGNRCNYYFENFYINKAFKELKYLSEIEKLIEKKK